MPHKNYCQQCGKSVEGKHDVKGHNVIADVAENQAQITKTAHANEKKKAIKAAKESS